MFPNFRELSVGARQWQVTAYITFEQRPEPVKCRLRRVRPISRDTSADICQNKSGTAEVFYTFVS